MTDELHFDVDSYLNGLDDAIDRAEERKAERDLVEMQSELKATLEGVSSTLEGKDSTLEGTSSALEGVSSVSSKDHDERSVVSKDHDERVTEASEDHDEPSSDCEDEVIDLDDSSITTYEDVPGPEQANHEDGGQVIGHSEINGIPVEVVKSDTKVDDSALQAKAQTEAENTVKRAKNEASMWTLNVDVDEFKPGTDGFKHANLILCGSAYVFTEIADDYDRAQSEDERRKALIRSELASKIMTFNDEWRPFQPPKEGSMHTLPEIIVIVKRLNKLFEYEFADTHDVNFQLGGLFDKICDFMSKHTDISDSQLDHPFIVSMFGKMEVELSAHIEQALKTHLITVGSDFVKSIKPDIDALTKALPQNSILRQSWNEFISSFIGIKNQTQRFNFDTHKYTGLNAILRECYCYEWLQLVSRRSLFAMEQLFANTLKCYQPMIAVCYFILFRTFYIMIRMLTLYFKLGKTADKDLKTVMEDISAIMTLCVVTYEQKYLMWKSMPKQPHSVDGVELSQEAELFIENYILTGAQYHFLKTVEHSFRVMAYSMVKNKE